MCQNFWVGHCPPPLSARTQTENSWCSLFYISLQTKMSTLRHQNKPHSEQKKKKKKEKTTKTGRYMQMWYFLIGNFFKQNLRVWWLDLNFVHAFESYTCKMFQEKRPLWLFLFFYTLLQHLLGVDFRLYIYISFIRWWLFGRDLFSPGQLAVSVMCWGFKHFFFFCDLCSVSL